MKSKSRQFARLFTVFITMFMNAENANPIPQEPIHVLVTSQTDGYRHESIPTAIKAFAEMAQDRNWSITFTEDSSFFNEQTLAKMDVIVLLMTIGDIFNDEQQDAIQQFVENGGGLFGVHSGTCTENDWPWMVARMGAIFTAHPPVCEAEIIIEDNTHPATQHYETERVLCEDEIYTFDRNPREHVKVLISVDETSYDLDNNPWFKEVETLSMDGDHPLVWYQNWKQGRIMQTALGHTHEQYNDSSFRKQLIGGLEWAAKRQ